MGARGWQLWCGTVQAAAFVCAAAGLALAFHIEDSGLPAAYPSANRISSLRIAFVIMLFALCLFGGPAYLYARPRFRQWRNAVWTGLVAGLVLGVGVTLLALPTMLSSMMGGRTYFVEGKPILDVFAMAGSMLLFFTGLGLGGAILVRAFVPGDIVDSSRDPARPRHRDGVPLALALAIIAAALWDGPA